MSVDHLVGEWLYYNIAAGIFTQRNFVADFIPLKNYFYFKNGNKSLFELPFGGPRVTYAFHL